MTDRTLAGKVALITGASRGIGAGVATRLAADGASVVITYAKSPDRAEGVVDNIATLGGRAFAIRADSSKGDDIERAIAGTVETYGQLDILVNNAGFGKFAELADLEVADIDWELSLNIRGTILATRAALKFLPDGGRIINIGSINADRMPFPGGSVYATTKGAIASFTRGMARELGPRKITINNVQPGPIDTEGNPASGPAAGSMLDVMAVDTFGTVEEVGAFVSYLAGPEAAFITGASLDIDGGFGA